MIVQVDFKEVDLLGVISLLKVARHKEFDNGQLRGGVVPC